MSAYRDPASEKLGNGRSMAELMRPGPRGLTGVIVGKASPGGNPENFDPHDANNICINLTNASGTQTHSVALSQMTPRAVRQAVAAAQTKVVGNDINAIRERAAVAFEELAKLAGTNVAAPSPPSPPPPPPEEPSEEALEAELRTAAQSLAEPAVDRSYSPMAAFGLKKAPPAATTSGGTSGSGRRVGAPQKLLYFEKEGLGTVPAFYHDVLVAVSRDDPETPEYSGFLVLIYDLRFEQHEARWFPPANDPYQRPWAVQIKDDKKLYLVQTTGFQYVYDNKEYCVLNVLRAVIAGVEASE